jgi:phosphate transport system protein
MEVEIDRELSSIIARRQPTARDLRLLMAISKTTANLERVGDEAERIARMVRSIIEERRRSRTLPASELRIAADLASGLLRKALDAFARLDTAAAVAILKEDDLLDKEFDGFVRKLITYMMEDPRTISSLDLLFVAKAIERIGDHAKNIAEFIIYVVKGADVRHSRWSTSSPRIREGDETPATHPDRRRRAGHRRTDGGQPAPQRLRAGVGRGRRRGPARDRRGAARRHPAGLDAAGPERPGAGPPLARRPRTKAFPS